MEQPNIVEQPVIRIQQAGRDRAHALGWSPSGAWFRAPVDPARQGAPIGACRRCRAANGPYGWRAVERGLRDLGESLAEIPPTIPTYAGPDGRRYTIPEDER